MLVLPSTVRIVLTAVAAAFFFACGGAVIDTTAPEEEEPQVICPTACATSASCCAGYACEDGACVPHLVDGRCRNLGFMDTCDPRLDGQCSAGEACTSDDVLDIECLPRARIGGLGDSCSESGEACKAGLWCMARFCHEACCSDGDCPPGEHCVVDYGQLGDFGACF